MCGIAGIVRFDGVADARRARRMADAMFHRGPDASGVFADGPVALAHRRLKIIDLSEAGAQPMTSGDGRFTIVYNGEIYNYAELRRDLERDGVRLRSTSDTEVLLECFARHGKSVLASLNGIFAFAIWDRARRVLTLARDHIGIKPLVYARCGASILFASEVKGLVPGGYAPVPDLGRVGEYLFFGSVAGERTLFGGVRRVGPGALLEIDPERGRLEEATYSRVTDTPIVDCSWREAVLEVRATLERAVERQLVSDVPVGSMCSGGLDSSAITALATRRLAAIDTFCIKIPVEGFDETEFARAVAGAVGARHHELVSSDRDAAELLATTIWLHDEPLTHPNSIPIFQISRLAKDNITVLLSGEGADEIFAGYVRYTRRRFVERLRRFSPRLLLRALVRGAPVLGRPGITHMLDAAGAATGAESVALMNARSDLDAIARVAPSSSVDIGARAQLATSALDARPNDAVAALLLYEQGTHLQTLLARQDAMCMGTSIESRVPFLDVEVMKLANGLGSIHKFRGRETKAVLREGVEDILPPIIRDRPKYAFALPLQPWFRAGGPFEDRLRGIASGPLAREGVLDAEAYSQMLAGSRAGVHRHADLLWALLNLDEWWRLQFTKESSPDPSQLPRASRP